MIFEYLTKLWKKGFWSLGLLPYVSDWLSAYKGYELKLPDPFPLIILIACILLSSFLVWIDQKKETLSLQKELSNPVNHDVKGHFHPYDFNITNSINRANENKKNAHKLLNDIKHKRGNFAVSNPSLVKDTVLNPVLKAIQEMDNEIQVPPQTYKEQLQLYLKQNDNYINELDTFKERYADKIYYVKFYLENIGRKSDEDIELSITSGNSTFIETHNVLNNFPDCPNFPELKIKKENAITKLQNDLGINKLLLNTPKIDSRRKQYKFFIDKLSIKIVSLNVGSSIDIFDEQLFIHTDNFDNIKFEIKSKHSTKVINNNITVIKKDLIDLISIIHGTDEDKSA